MRRLLSLLLIAAGLAAPHPARAQNKAAADAAFKEGKRLLEKGETAAACARFEGSLDLLAQLGVRLNLADCYERLGKLTAAYAEFRAAEMEAGRTGDARAQFARDRLAAIDARIPVLTIKLAAGADIAGLEIKRDGQVVGGGLLDTPLPVDPGEHTVEASAPGHEPWSTRVEAVERSRPTVEVPVLRPREKPGSSGAPASPVKRPPRAPMEDDTPSEGQPGQTPRLLGIGIGAAGAAALATGVFFGVRARSKWSDAQVNGHCDGDGACDEIGYPLAQDARRAALTSTILAGGGLVAVAAGAVLYVKGARAGRRQHAQLTPVIRPDGAGLAVRGSF